MPDLKNSQVTVKGTFSPTKLVEYVYKRTGKHATIIQQDPPEEKKEEAGKEGKEDKKEEAAGDQEGKKAEQKGEEGKSDKKEEGGGGGGGQEGKPAIESGDGAATTVEEGPKIVEIKRNEFYYYPPRYAMEMYAYPPQIFSDENPNACSIM